MTKRADNIAFDIGSTEVDALLCFHGDGFSRLNVRYLSGFTGSSAAVLIACGHRVLFTDGRYQDQAAAECIGWEVAIILPGEKLADIIVKYCQINNLRRVGYEPEGITAGMLDELRDIGDTRFMPVFGIVEERRRCKGKDELRAIEDAAGVADAALEATAALVREGVSEREIAMELDTQMWQRGSEEPAFPTIVVAGPRSALPHALPTDRPIALGDIVCIDSGATVDGYRSDLTRSWVVGEPTDKQIRFHAAVMRAHDRALALVRPGVSSGELNAVVRDEFAAADIKECWRHSIGHGVGLSIHEWPSLREGLQTELIAGDVVTIEPGAYQRGWGGVRIEDLVLVTNSCSRTLSAAPRELKIISA